MWSVRAIVSAVTAAGAAAGAGRAMLNRRIDRQTDEVIARGIEEARQRVRDGASSFLTDAWRDYAISCGVKLLCLGGILALTFSELIPRPAAAGLVAVFLVVSIGYDIIVRRKLLWSILQHIREHGIRPRTIINTLVAREVFAEAMQSASASQPNLTNKIMFALSGRNRDTLEHKVALAVSDAASSFAWQDIRPFLRTAALRFAGLLMIYSGSVAAILYVLESATQV